MEGKTHRLGGAVAMLGMFEYLRLTGNTLEGVHPLTQLAIMYPSSAFGAVFPDIDHHEGSNPIKTPAGELFHKLVHVPNKLARKFNRDSKGKPKNKTIDKLVVVKHRAWQTHSILFTGGLTYLLWRFVENWAVTTGSFDATICLLLVSGFFIGLASHIFLDSLTTSGVYLFMKWKIKFVPKSSFFSTGNDWETKWVTSILSMGFTFLAFSIIFSVFGIELIPTIEQAISTGIDMAQEVNTNEIR